MWVCVCMQGLLMVSWWQHHSILGAWGQRHPSQSDSDANAFSSGDQGPQPVQCCWLQTALAEERRLPLCQSGQDTQGNTGTGERKREGTRWGRPDWFKNKKNDKVNFVSHVSVRVWSPTLKSSAWERNRFLWMWWRWKVILYVYAHTHIHKIILVVSQKWNQSFAVVVLVLPESIIAFAWEPNGSKFAVLHGESPRISASFYHVKNNGKIELISEYSYTHSRSQTWGNSVASVCMSVVTHQSNLHWIWCCVFCRVFWQTAGQQHLLEPPRTIYGSSWTQEVSCTCMFLLESVKEKMTLLTPASNWFGDWLYYTNALFFLGLVLKYEWGPCLCGHVRLHHDEHCWALHGLWRGVGPNRSLCCHLCLLVEPQGILWHMSQQHTQ